MLACPRMYGGAAITAPDPGVLLAWYDSNRRDLPWRRDTDPYRVLVSEIMLQQTRAAVVAKRYPQFLDRFPSVEALAVADEEEVLVAWSGLGYYRRARSLHAAAEAIVSTGEWPQTAAELERLPGVGPYTAAAVASIAFDEPVVVVDGNVRRVAARLIAEEGDPNHRRAAQRLRDAAAAWVSQTRPGDSNQALMELGATVCKPRPLCCECPLTASCVARSNGVAENFPVAAKRSPPIELRWRLAVIREQGQLWLERRIDTAAWLPGMFELPWVDANAASHDASDAHYRQKYGRAIHLETELAEVKHTIGRRAIVAEVWSAHFDTAAAGTVAESRGRWVKLEQFEQLPTSSLVGKALAAAGCSVQPRREPNAASEASI